MIRTMPLLLLLLWLAGCATSSPDMMGAQRGQVELQGIRFAVFHDRTEAEVVRMGYLTRRERAPVPQLMAQAAQMVSGCAVIPGSIETRIPGDTGVARFQLLCEAAQPLPRNTASVSASASGTSACSQWPASFSVASRALGKYSRIAASPSLVT